ncbi:protein serine kinase H1 (predicted), isoform CRA_a [Rattus norvegicus]|uniref:Protein serine kinase H1 (Predicted), isoform CRA_a n=1 Tax=Rattus norvegicus TaxID=10116 RepID=A6IYT9_RAT|nr:protein serine kinase H1 [Rattus norvegicus]EDL92417.1 protein serine kinase H1 (predicted), isoform CRA_a [Rattus norvegicus]|eukprot:NP_001102367.1 protein serine kinase H1 [Rattus norvegicus]
MGCGTSKKSSPTFVLSFGVLPFAASLLELPDPPLQLHCATYCLV